MKKTNILSLLAAVSACGFSTSIVNAQLIYDGFNYTSGEALAAQNGGSGFSAAWASPGSAVTATIVSGLTFGSLSTTGNAVSVTVNSANGWGTQAVIGRPVTTAPSTTYWASNLFEVISTGGFDVIGVGSGSNGFDPGQGVFGTSYNDSSKPAIRGSSGDVGFGSSLSLNTIYLTVAQYTASSINAWIFDTSSYSNWVTNGSTQPGLTTYALMNGSISDPGTFDTNVLLGGYTPDGNSATLIFDEVRFGDSLASVTPVPEPSTFAVLIGATVFGMVFRRRRV